MFVHAMQHMIDSAVAASASKVHARNAVPPLLAAVGVAVGVAVI